MSAFEDDVEPLEEARGMARQGSSSGTGIRGSSSSGTTDAFGKRMREPSPEPDEDLDTAQGKHSTWLVKVPRFLLEGWAQVSEDDRKLGTVRVYDPDHRGKQRMELLLPPHPEPAIPLPPTHPLLQNNYPRKYDLRLTSDPGSERVRNLYAFKERLEGADDEDDDNLDDEDSDYGDGIKGKEAIGRRSNKGKRVVSMVGTIAQEAACKPQIAAPFPGTSRGGSSTPTRGAGITPEYREVLRRRRLEASKPRHSVKVLDQSDLGRANMLGSGVGAGFVKGPKASLIASTGSSAQGGARGDGKGAERFARMPRNELLDALFELFEEYPYWSIKGLREKVQQPEVYLREVLTTVADLHKRGPYSGNWSLKPMFVEMRKQQSRAAAAASTSTSGAAGSSSAANVLKKEEADSDDDEDDDDDDEAIMQRIA